MKFRILQSILALLLVTFCGQLADAQIFDRIKKRTQQKIERKIENKIVEEISDEIAQRAFRPVEKAVDNMLKESYEEEQKKQGKEVDWDDEDSQNAYSDFLASLNKTVELPEEYTLDIIMDIETRDYDGTKRKMKMYYAKDKAMFAIGQKDEKDRDQLILMDVENDVVVLYTTDKKGSKTAQAIPSVMKIGAAFVNTQVEDNSLNIQATGNTKKVAGYNCTLYAGDSDEELITAYIAENFPINWEDGFGAYFRQFAPRAYSEYSENVKGMILETESIRKSDDSLKSSWKTKKVKEKKFVITNSDYKFEK